MARQGSGRHPRGGSGRGGHGMGWVRDFPGNSNQAVPSGAFLRGLRPLSAALWGAPMLCAFGTSGPRLAVPLCASLGVMERGGGGVGRVLEDSGRCELAGRGALVARQGSGRGLAAWNGFGLFREIQPCCALRRFSAGPSGRSRPRFPALPCCASRHIHVVPSSGLMPCPRHIHAAPLVPPFPSVRGRRWGVVARSGGGPGSPGRFGVSWGHPGRCGLAGRGALVARQGSGRGPRWGSGWRPAAEGLGFF